MASAASGTGSPLALAGLDAEDERVYRRVLRATEPSLSHLSEVTGLTRGELQPVLERCARAGLVRLAGDEVTATPPASALAALIAEENQRIQAESARLDALRNLVPSLLAEVVAARSGGSAPVDVEPVEGGDVVDLLGSLAHASEGDLLWLRPDQWRLPVTQRIDALVLDLVTRGRRSRALYPARVLEEAPEVVRTRAEAGEQVRIVADLPSRLAIFGSSAALMSDTWGMNTGRRLVVREAALVGALTSLFESIWERGVALPGLGGGSGDDAMRRLLLHQLSHGAKDEQIARALGLSLRTVRRRVADLMLELGVSSRFQAGVEAVRRGWI